MRVMGTARVVFVLMIKLLRILLVQVVNDDLCHLVGVQQVLRRAASFFRAAL